ncbi:MAG: metal ABC transporter permease, partial [Pseudomonadota bacterium]
MPQFLIDLQHYPFLQNALLTGILAGVPCGVIGTYIMVRRIS